jgi:hypothetical protein
MDKHAKLVDKRKAARVKKQTFEEMVYMDSISMDQYIEYQILGKKFTVYGFSGQSTQCDLRIDWDPGSNANMIADFFQVLETIKPNSVDVFMLDPIFEIFYNPNPAVWEKAIRDDRIPKTMKNFPDWFGHPNKWIHAVFEKVKPGGLLIQKRDIRNINGLSTNPKLFYVHDSRPMAYIVRIDQK